MSDHSWDFIGHVLILVGQFWMTYCKVIFSPVIRHDPKKLDGLLLLYLCFSSLHKQCNLARPLPRYLSPTIHWSNSTKLDILLGNALIVGVTVL